jgi:hypothetical protein
MNMEMGEIKSSQRARREKAERVRERCPRAIYHVANAAHQRAARSRDHAPGCAPTAGTRVVAGARWYNAWHAGERCSSRLALPLVAPSLGLMTCGRRSSYCCARSRALFLSPHCWHCSPTRRSRKSITPNIIRTTRTGSTRPDKGCCNNQDCGELKDENERTTSAGTVEVKIDSEWCPVLPHHYLKRGNAPRLVHLACVRTEALFGFAVSADVRKTALLSAEAGKLVPASERSAGGPSRRITDAVW